jgi:hypothetical protein
MPDDIPLASPAAVLNGWRALPAIAVAAVGLVALAVPVRAQEEPPQPEPYRDPPFTCEVHDHGTEAPTLPAPQDDPLCVRYDKTNITVSTLEVVDFLAAEPGRIGLVAGKCAYWQQDHWIVRVTPEDPAAIVEWEGSYWYDARTGSAAGILRNLRVGGQPADGEAFAEAMRPLIGDEAADELASFAAEGGGGGATFQLPEGFAYPECAGPGSEPADPPPPDPAPAPGAPTPSPTGPTASNELALPRTGGSPALGLALAALSIGVATRGLLGRST